MAFSLELRLHAVTGLPATDPTVVVEVAAGSDTRWSSAPQNSFGTVAFMGAWASLVLQRRDLEIRVRDKAGSAALVCTAGGTFSAYGTLQLPEVDVEAADEWREVELDLEYGKTSNIARALEAKMQTAADDLDKLDRQLEKSPKDLAELSKQLGDVVGRAGSSSQPDEPALASGAAAAEEPDKAGATAGGERDDDAKSTGSQGASVAAPAVHAAAVAEARTTIKLSYRVRAYQAGAPFVYEKEGALMEVSATKLPPTMHSYAHGGFMGLACSMLCDPVWSDVLKKESPDAWAAVNRITHELQLVHKHKRPNRFQTAYMTGLENSPILCAYGMLRTGCLVPVDAALSAPPSIQGQLDQLLKELASRSFARRAPQLGDEAAAEAPGQQAMSASSQQAQESGPEGKTFVFEHSLHSRRGMQRLDAYRQSMEKPNRYGYMPLAMEWDIWVNPTEPMLLHKATINHGSAGALVTQAITTAVPCMGSCARSAGLSQIKDEGLSPVEWLNQLGRAINTTVNGDPNKALQLFGPEEFYFRVKLEVLKLEGISSAEWGDVYVIGDLDSDDCVLPQQRTGEGIFSDSILTWKGRKNEMKFWPVPSDLNYDDLVLEIRGDPAGVRFDKCLGMVRLSLRKVVREHPDLLHGQAIELPYTVGVKHERRMNAARSPAKKDMAEPDEEAEADDVSPAVGARSTGDETPSVSGPGSGRLGTLTLRLQMEPVGVLEAAQALGVEPAAAQTCTAMLSCPGGIYLDVKSAYSSPRDLQQFVSVMRGIGVHCKAVCSFQKRQLEIGPIADTVMFFHGLAGLENACDDGVIGRGQFVLFNGASLLMDLNTNAIEKLPDEEAAKLLSASVTRPVDLHMLKKYLGLCDFYGIVGGIYVQEPDTAASSVDALVRLVVEHAHYFPLGFAYGHLSGRAVSFMDLKGRGFASQQLVEELVARQELANKVVHKIERGEHRSTSTVTLVSWAGRVLNSDRWFYLSKQRAFIALLAEIWPFRSLPGAIEELGGFRKIFVRFWEHYEYLSPVTLLEAGFNHNYTKSFVRLLRNREYFAAASLETKKELASFFCGPQLQGLGLTKVLMITRLRLGLHKLAKEGLLCLLESCTKEECEQVLEHLGGREKVWWRLKGRWRLSSAYCKRLEDIEATHAKEPLQLAFKNKELKYAMLPMMRHTNESGKISYTHTRDKQPREQVRRVVRKITCCGTACCYTAGLEILTCGFYIPCCVVPRFCGGVVKVGFGAPALLAMVVGFVLMIALVVCLVVFFRVG